MTYKEAKAEAERYNTYTNYTAKVVRILPRHLDPVREGDNGWDVEVTVL